MSDPDLVACPGCGASVRREALSCRNCGRRLQPTPLNWGAIWSIGVFVLAVLGALVFFILDSIRR